jgi:hypothetical protein
MGAMCRISARPATVRQWLLLVLRLAPHLLRAAAHVLGTLDHLA